MAGRPGHPMAVCAPPLKVPIGQRPANSLFLTPRRPVAPGTLTMFWEARTAGRPSTIRGRIASQLVYFLECNIRKGIDSIWPLVLPWVLCKWQLAAWKSKSPAPWVKGYRALWSWRWRERWTDPKLRLRLSLSVSRRSCLTGNPAGTAPHRTCRLSAPRGTLALGPLVYRLRRRYPHPCRWTPPTQWKDC